MEMNDLLMKQSSRKARRLTRAPLGDSMTKSQRTKSQKTKSQKTISQKTKSQMDKSQEDKSQIS